MTADRRVRLAVVGVGHLGRHHARVAAELPGVELVGIHDHHVGRAENVARERGIPVLRDVGEVAELAEAVVVATPTSSHARLGRFFLERDRDVLLEKPIAGSVAEADALVGLARERGRVLAVGHVERHNPAVEAVMAQVRDPVFVEVHRLGRFTPRSLDVDVVLDLMIHDLQIVAALVGRPILEIRAAGAAVLTDRLDIAHARVAFEGGAVANLTASRVSAERMRKLRVFSRSLYVSADMHARRVTAARLSRAGERPEIVAVEVPVDGAEPLERELRDFSGAVRERRPALVSGEVGRDALGLAERVLEAIEEHRRSLDGRGE